MTNSKSTKRALLTSVLAMLLCVLMLVGTTFAWFTDTASTGVNKIQAGNLDVALEMATAWNADGSVKTWASAEGKTLSFKKAASAPDGEEILWEPGCTYVLPELRVVNKGNLALKYKIAITGINGDSKLCEVIDWYCGDTLISKASGMVVSDDVVLEANAEGASFTIKGHMQETAGNDYQNLTLNGIGITVYATQATVESDSFNDQYDAQAEYKYVDTEAELTAALQAGKNVILNSTIELTSMLQITGDAQINGNGNALISGKPVQVAKDADVTFRNVSFTNPVNVSENYGGRDVGSNLYAGSNASRYTGKLVLDGCSFSGSKWDCVQAVVDSGAEVVINNCRFELNEAAPSGNKTRFIHIEAAQNSNADVKVTMTNNFFGASTYINEALIDIDYINLNGINFGGNNVYTDTTADIYVCGSSMGRTISKDDAYKALGSKLVTAATQDDLNNAINSNSAVTVKLDTAGTYTLPSVSNKEVSIIGSKDTVIDVTAAVALHNTSVTMEGVTVKSPNADYTGLQHTKAVTFKNCSIEGQPFLYAADAQFIGCTFTQTNNKLYNVWTYGSKTVLFKDCTFNCAGKSVLIYNEGTITGQTVEFQNCKFNASAPVKDKAAIEIDSRLISGTYTVIIDKATADSVTGFGIGSNSGNSVWNNKLGNHATVIVDGNTVLSAG